MKILQRESPFVLEQNFIAFVEEPHTLEKMARQVKYEKLLF